MTLINIEVFKTNVLCIQQADQLISLLLHNFPGGRITFDLEDCDRVLRVQHENIDTDNVVSILSGSGFECRVLEN